MSITLPIIILDTASNATCKFLIVNNGQNNNTNKKRSQPTWLMMPGGWGCFSFSLNGIYQAWKAGFGCWTGGNEGFDLFRYFGCKITFFPDPWVSFITSTTVDVQGPEYYCWTSYVQPYIMKCMKGRTKIILASADALQRRRLPKMWVPRPSTMNNGWYKTKDMCKFPLLAIKTSIYDIRQQWWDGIWSSRPEEKTDLYFPWKTSITGGKGTNTYDDGFKGQDYTGYVCGWLSGPKTWGPLSQQKQKITDDDWKGDYYTAGSGSGQTSNPNKNDGSLIRVGAGDGPNMPKTLPKQGAQLIARFCFYFQWGSGTRWADICNVQDPCTHPWWPIPGSEKDSNYRARREAEFTPTAPEHTMQYTTRAEDYDKHGFLTESAFARLTRSPLGGGREGDRGGIRGRHGELGHRKRRRTETGEVPGPTSSEEEAYTTPEETPRKTGPGLRRGLGNTAQLLQRLRRIRHHLEQRGRRWAKSRSPAARKKAQEALERPLP